MARNPRPSDGTGELARGLSLLDRVTRGGKIVLSEELLERARAGEGEAARALLGKLSFGVQEGRLAAEHVGLLAEALLRMRQGAPVERAFMRSTYARSKAGNKTGSMRSGDPAIRRTALERLRAMNPRTDEDVRAGIRKIAKRAGVKTHKTIERDIRRQLAEEAARPQWSLPDLRGLTYDELRERYPGWGHEAWAAVARWGSEPAEVEECRLAALGDDGEMVEIKLE